MGRDKRPGAVEAHIRINLSLLESPAFIALDWTARALFLDMRNRMRSSNNGNISAALSELVHRGWTSSTTLAKALRQLEAVGLLRKTRQTIGVERGSKVCNLYRFTDVEVFGRPKLGIEASKATDDFKAFKTLADAARAVAAASPAKKNAELKKKRALQKLHLPPLDQLQKLQRQWFGKSPAKPMPMRLRLLFTQTRRTPKSNCRNCTPLHRLPTHGGFTT